ncbi:MAG: GTPase ObgE [Candidatus Roizmanbacteria bacterium]|nr:GTPase ObgE [Candidatus Roizmanbacteria bacterium]
MNAKAGKGGAGRVAFFPMKAGPCGGDGGDGGTVIVRGKKEVKNLNTFATKKAFVAEDGGQGENFNKTGHRGADSILYVPLNTEVVNTMLKTKIVITEVDHDYILCKGGKGGRGNDKFKSATNQTPKHAEPGTPGESFHFKIILKLIADAGFIGLPNAGKSSLLNEITNARVATAPYPFTTLEPNLGAFEHFVIADVPGLIEGASKGKGLGSRFLKHIEKVKVLYHCISAESDTPENEYNTVRTELSNSNPILIEKKELILLTKIDLLEPEARKKRIKALEKKLGLPVLGVSIHDLDSIEALKKNIRDNVEV